MTRNSADACVYMKRNNGQIVLVAIYLDDLLVSSSCANALEDTDRLLTSRFKMKDHEESKMIFGIEIFRDRPQKSLFMS